MIKKKLNRTRTIFEVNYEFSQSNKLKALMHHVVVDDNDDDDDDEFDDDLNHLFLCVNVYGNLRIGVFFNFLYLVFSVVRIIVVVIIVVMY